MRIFPIGDRLILKRDCDSGDSLTWENTIIKMKKKLYFFPMISMQHIFLNDTFDIYNTSEFKRCTLNTMKKSLDFFLETPPSCLSHFNTQLKIRSIGRICSLHENTWMITLKKYVRCSE